MSHLTRQQVPKRWPIERKGSVYVVRPNFDLERGVPLLIVLRDMMKLAQNRREAKKILHSRQILVNEKPAKDEKSCVLFMDSLRIVPIKKSYRLELSEKGKFFFEEISEKEAGKKIERIINKKMLNGKKTQLNLMSGRNVLSEIKCKVNDSVIVNVKDGKIEKCLPLEEKANVVVFSGKHIGKKGKIEKLNLEQKTAKIKANDMEINILIKQLMVVE